jgi:hypothetical protein
MRLRYKLGRGIGTEAVFGAAQQKAREESLLSGMSFCCTSQTAWFCQPHFASSRLTAARSSQRIVSRGVSSSQQTTAGLPRA